MKKTLRIAVDGPVGAGKSALSRECARRLGFLYVDTGALYRALGVYCKENEIDVYDDEKTAEYIASGKVEVDLRFIGEAQDKTQRVFVNNEDLTDKIRTPEASMLASRISANPEVRAFLLEAQRALARNASVIMDGRDIGSVVLPEAEIKIFLTAKPEERAKRRYLELVEKGIEADFETTLNDLNKRDYDDSRRAVAPLKQVEDAVLLDTTNFSFEESAEKIMEIIKRFQEESNG